MSIWATLDSRGNLSNFHTKGPNETIRPDEVRLKTIPTVPAPWKYDAATGDWKRPSASTDPVR